MDEDSYPDGSYDVHLVATEDAYAAWVVSLGMHEVESAQPAAREWQGPEVDGCRMGAYLPR